MAQDVRVGATMRRWTALGLALGVPGVLGPYLLFVQADSEAATVDPDTYYTLVSVRSDKVMDVPGADASDGAWIRQTSRAADAASQQWRLRAAGDGYVELENRGSHKVLGVRGASTKSAAAVEQQTDHGSASQQWKVEDVGGAAVKFVSRSSKMVLDVWGGSGGEGVPLVQYADQGSTNQQWRLVKASGSGGYTWHNAQIVGGGFVTGLVFNPARKGLLYARTDVGGAYRWDSTAARWTSLTDWIGGADWNLLGIESLATDPVDPDRVYLASGSYTNGWAGNGAILRSTDQGKTFQRTDLPFKLGGNEDGRSMGERLAVDPANHGTLYLGTRKNGLWRSTDYGVTWSQVNSFPVKDGASSGVGLSFVTFGPVEAAGRSTWGWPTGPTRCTAPPTVAAPGRRCPVGPPGSCRSTVCSPATVRCI